MKYAFDAGYCLMKTLVPFNIISLLLSFELLSLNEISYSTQF